MNLEDFYKNWLSQSGIDRGKNDAVSFMRFYGVPTAAQDYMGQMDAWLGGQGQRQTDYNNLLSQFRQGGTPRSDMQGLRQRIPAMRQNVTDQIQAGRNVARASNIGNRMAGANSYARGVMADASQQGEGLASRYARMGLGSAAQAGAVRGAQNQARALGAQARLGTMTPNAQMGAAQQAAQGYGMASNAMGQEANFMQMLQGMDSEQINQLLRLTQGMGAVNQMQRPDLSQLLALSQAFAQWQGTKPQKKGTNWGGLLGGVANLASGGLSGLFGGGGGSGIGNAVGAAQGGAGFGMGGFF